MRGRRLRHAAARGPLAGLDRRRGFVDHDLDPVVGLLQRQPTQRLDERCVLAPVHFADRDPAQHALRIRVAQAVDEPPELLFGRHRDRHAGTGAEQHGREVLDVRVRERAHDVLGDERERVGAEVVEIAEPGEQHEFREQGAANGRHHEDLAELRGEHPAQRELADRPAEGRIDRGGGAARVDVAKHAEHDRARVGVDDAAVHQPQFEHARGRGNRRRLCGVGRERTLERRRGDRTVEFGRDHRLEQPSARVRRQVLQAHLVRCHATQRRFRERARLAQPRA